VNDVPSVTRPNVTAAPDQAYHGPAGSAATHTVNAVAADGGGDVRWTNAPARSSSRTVEAWSTDVAIVTGNTFDRRRIFISDTGVFLEVTTKRGRGGPE